jgi:hypothetical protein
MSKVLIFIFGLPAGILTIIYRRYIVGLTGKWPWAEEKLGPGGTYTVVILAGIVIWIGCMMYALGSFDQILGFLSQFFRG